jgi:flagellar export protein FliJ
VNRFFRLSPVLRTRKAQEDSAKGAVNASRAEIREAQQLVKRRAFDLTGADAPTEGTARAMVASMVARQSLAASLSGAHQMVADAEEQTREKIAELADAANRRRAVEKMAERHAETVRQHDLKTDQANLDELAITAKARTAARGIDAVSEQRANSLRHTGGSAADREGVARSTANDVAAQRPAIELADPALAIAARRRMLTHNPDTDKTDGAAKEIEPPAEVDSESTDRE